MISLDQNIVYVLALATFNSPMQQGSNPQVEGRNQKTRPVIATPVWLASSWRGAWLTVLAGVALLGRGGLVLAEDSDSVALTHQAFDKAKREYQTHPQNPEVAWHFARAAFDLGDLATNNSVRAELAQQGIAACKQALTNHNDSAPLHYYLGLNQGQLARTRRLGALRLVDLMEREFLTAIELDSLFDYAGAERTLGMLYRDAPVFASIGSRTKARLHLQRALELAPRYPDNRLVMVESLIKWGDRKAARQELKLLEDVWPAAQTEFAGPAWAASWTDWTARLEQAKKILEEPARLESPRH